ncbi:MAG TPA: GNAT family protein [Candidatus Limnocylindrales bacterium]|nr:GNAT family protein [Candidatus Limnocylindrales bacterium]
MEHDDPAPAGHDQPFHDPRPMGRTSPPFEPRPVTLAGRLVRLEPLEGRHLDGIRAIALDAELWRWTRHVVDGPPALEAYLVAARTASEAGTEIAFAQVDVASGRVAGMTRFHSIEPAHRRLEIGNTWLAAPFQGTGHNAEAKLLLLDHAFEALGAHRVEFKTDGLNARSQAALAAIGATREGTLRRHVVNEDGRVRDSVYFSVVWDEWPTVRERLAARVEAAARRAT